MKKLITIFSLIFLVLITFNLVFPAQADDFAHFLNATDANISFFNSYLNWNGRFGELIWSGYFAKFINTLELNILNSLISTVFIFAFFYLIFARLPKNELDYLSLAVICGLLVNNHFAVIFLWGAGFTNYLWGIGLILLFLVPYRLMWDKFYFNQQTNFWQFNLKECVFALVIIPIGIVAGWSSEHVGALTSFVLVLSLFYAWHKNIKLPFWYIIGVLSFIIGFIILFKSPGSNKRGLNAHTAGFAFFTIKMIWEMSFLEKMHLINQTFKNYLLNICFYQFGVCLSWFYVYKTDFESKYNRILTGIFLTLLFFGILILSLSELIPAISIYIFVLFLLWKMRKSLGSFYSLFSILFLSWTATALILIQIAALFNSRAMFGNNLILMAIEILMFRDFYLNSKFKSKIKTILLCALSISTLLCFSTWAYYGYNWKKIENIIQTSKANGIYDVVIPKKYLDFSNFIFDLNWEIPTEDPNFWINVNCAQYYGVKSITVQ